MRLLRIAYGALQALGYAMGWVLGLDACKGPMRASEGVVQPDVLGLRAFAAAIGVQR